MTLLVWLSIGLLLHTWFGYLALLALGLGVREAASTARWLAGAGDRRQRAPERDVPVVSIVIACSGDEAGLGAKLANTLELDWPRDRLEVLIGCEGGAGAAAVATAAADARVRVVERAGAGKAATLSRLLLLARGELVVFTDPAVLLDRGALGALVRPLRDPAAGAVVGRLVLVRPGADGEGERLTSRYETLLKYLEGRNGCVVGAEGAPYAVRRMLLTPLPPDTLADDLVLPLRVALRGWKVPYAADAVAREASPGVPGQEFARRVRTAAGDWQALWRHPEVLDPGSGFVAFAFFSHELLRWISPALLGVLGAGSLLLALGGGGAGWWAVVGAQALGYGLALAGNRAPASVRRAAVMARHAVALHAALALGFWRYVRGRRLRRAVRVARAGAPAALAREA